MPNNKKNIKTRMLSVEETNAALEKEFAEQNPKAGDLPLNRVNPKLLTNLCNQVPSWLKKQWKLFLTVQQWGQMDDPCVNQKEHISLPTVARQMRTQKSF